MRFERVSASLSDTAYARVNMALWDHVAAQKLHDDITVLRKQSTTFYESEISRLMDMVQRLQDSHVMTRNTLDHAQYAHSSIACLPIEVLSLIFLFVNNNPPTLVRDSDMTMNGDIAEHADTADLRHVCREWKHVVASLPELHRVVVNIEPFSPPRTNFWLNTYFIESTDDTPIDWVVHPWDFHDESHEAYAWKRCECQWCVAEVHQYEALPGEPEHGVLYVLAETASRTHSVTVFLSPAGTDWLISHTSPDEYLDMPDRVPPFFPILTSIRLDFSEWDFSERASWVLRAPFALFSNAPKLVKVSFDECEGLDVKKIILPWRQLRDLSIEDCTWKDIHPMLLACVALQRLCLRRCKPFKSICQFLSMMEDHSGDLSKPATHTPKYLPQLEALDLVLARDECDASSYNDLYRVVQARCEHRISTSSCSFSQLNTEFEMAWGDGILSGFIQKLEEFTEEKKLKFSCSCKK
ncbi:hypothetical protein FISHEDRAFT_78174 [Fistulina hepatica ATCC 64428]|nr:hypothetical protein FISHEDRAFT_78174 [Fistulina hepatica ATCC 64428]